MTKKITGIALRQHSPTQVSKLGACDDCVDALSQDIVKIPATLYNVNELDLPLTTPAAHAFFDTTMSQFAGANNDAATGRQSNTIVTNASSQPFLLRCVQPFVSIEALGFNANGAAYALAASTPGSSVTPGFDGVVPILSAASGLTQAWLEWGTSTWKMVKELFQAYRLQMPLGNTFILFDELVADVGTTDSHNTWNGFSNSLSGIPEFVRHVNDNMRLQGAAAEPAGTIFIPATSQNVGTVASPINAGVPTPLVAASWGGPNMKGLYGGCYPARGITFMPGQPIYLNYVREESDSIFYNALISAVTNKVGFTYDATLSGVVSGGGITGATVTGQASFTKFVGGKAKVGTSLRGMNMTPRCVIEWYAMMSGMYGTYFCSTYAKDQIDNMATTQCSTLLGLKEGDQVTKMPKSALLKRLADVRKGSSGGGRSFEYLSYLAGVPGIDTPDPATRLAPADQAA